MTPVLKSVLSLLLLIFLAIACKKESFYSGSDATLNFSTDTVSFDTAFTSVGTSTRVLMVYNPYSQYIKINSIFLAGGAASKFKININGQSVTSLTDIEIAPKDSLFIFLQFFMNASEKNQPILIKDSIIFNVNQHVQDVKLEAYGQDVHIMDKQTIGTSEWKADKPYLIRGNVTIDSVSTLTIDKGAKLYFHNNANLKVKGTLIAKGDFENPILFTGDRLEKSYEHVNGQWGGIGFLPGSKNNVIDWAIVENGISGIQIGGYNESSLADLSLSNTIIRNMSYNCLLAYKARITAYNCVIVNANKYTCGLLDGGDYIFYHCTLANYQGHSQSTLYFSNVDTANVPTDIAKASFYNAIIYGDGSNELLIDFPKETKGLPYFENCLVKIYDTLIYKAYFTNTQWNQDNIFIDVEHMNFELDTLSAAQDKGNSDIGKLYPFDLKNKSRILDGKPDIGAYERVQK